jgi:YD repeat-containing protein
VAGGLNYVTQYGYDEVGNRISQTDANNHTTTYSYDQNGRRVGRKLPAGQSETYVYDVAGNLHQKIDFNGKTTTYAYDTSNRLLSKTPDASFHAPAVSFTYKANGLRATMSDVSGGTTYGYDARNRLTSKQTPFGTLTYTYDNAGDVATITSSNTNGASLTYSYDELNRKRPRVPLIKCAQRGRPGLPIPQRVVGEFSRAKCNHRYLPTRVSGWKICSACMSA